MPDYELNVVKTLEYKRPEIDKGYADSTIGHGDARHRRPSTDGPDQPEKPGDRHHYHHG